MGNGGAVTQNGLSPNSDVVTTQLLGDGKTQIRISKMELKVDLNIIDFGFHAVGDDTFFEKANALVLVCDVTDASSLEQLLFKYQDFLNKTPSARKRRTSSAMNDPPRNGNEMPFIPVIVAANKCDLKEMRVLSYEDIQDFVAKKIRPIIENQLEEQGLLQHYSYFDHMQLNDLEDDSSNATDNTSPRHSFICAANNSNWSPSPILAGQEMENEKKAHNEHDNNATNENAGNGRIVAKKKKQMSPIDENRKIVGTPVEPEIIQFDDQSVASDSDDRQSIDADTLESMFADSAQVSIVQCSAATGHNVDQVFKQCIHKVLPSRLSEAGHKRTKTTALVTAPIWLRQIVDDFADSDEGASPGKKLFTEEDSFVLLPDEKTNVDLFDA
ncbi:hypothetical protein RFI_13170 [Reticulomyxa filosa]|uniref:Uncharacterized protein n=1 Tax=Reticulomyxa filosa TaxID=46433 RepID=X6NDC8_RETFI|nr:hypothetical protein RFI_13170 [Reticulomyxa filosa]|eukprot:ETO23991.1 hypothetical protein RFI_13170 [Reticulomyxa filosa]